MLWATVGTAAHCRSFPYSVMSEAAASEQHFLFGRGEGDQPGYDGAQLRDRAHPVSSGGAFLARNSRVCPTVIVISAKPIVCSLVSSAAGSTGL